MSRARPVWPKVPAGFVKAWLAGHSGLGLFFAALAYLVCVTGTAATFVDEFRRWEQPNAPEYGRLAPEAVRGAIDRAVSDAKGLVTGVSLQLPTPDFPRATLSVSDDRPPKAWYLDATGAPAVEKAATWTDFLSKLHMNLHVPGSWGYLLVGIVGVGMVGLALSGLLAHPRIFRDAFVLRWGGSKRLQEADLHNRLSVWGLPFNLVISVSGAYFGLVGMLVMAVAAVAYDGDKSKPAAAVRAPVVMADARPAPRLDVAAAVEQIRADPAVRDQPFSVYLARPGTAGQSLTVYGQVEKRLVYGELYHFDGAGRRTKVGWSDGAFGQQLYASAYSMHFGDFAGLPVKGLYFALGYGLCVVCSSGVAIWLARRRDRGRPAPLWERLWAATAWGVPLALAVSAFTTLVTAANPLGVFWGAAGVIYLVGFVVQEARPLAQALKLVLGLVLAMVVAAHLAKFGASALAPVSGAIDAILLAAAAGLVTWTFATLPLLKKRT